MKRRGFTLVEMLVIVGVVALLAVIFLPVFRRAKAKIDSVKCPNNLKALSLACLQYLKDNNQHYPLVFTESNTYGWAGALAPYVKDARVLQCPLDAASAASSPTSRGYSDYFYNANFMVRSKQGQLTTALSSSLGSSPQTILLGEGGSDDANLAHDAAYNQCGDGKEISNPLLTCSVALPTYALLPDAQRHTDGANYAYADGHIKWLRGNTPTQSSQILNNGLTRKTIAQSQHSGKATFSLLAK